MPSSTTLALAACALALGGVPSLAQDAEMSFFITSQNPGEGGDLGGLEGADAHCAALAEAAGAPAEGRRAYLSTDAQDARDRVGSGPRVNAEGVTVAESVEDLPGEAAGFTKEAALDETGVVVNGRGDEPDRHDILTGSDLEGRLAGGACADWTSGAEGSAKAGHHDRTGGGPNPTAWNSAHESQGCGMEALRSTGGDGLFHCFRAN